MVFYVLFGAMTTAVNWGVGFALYDVIGFPASISNAIAWFLSVLFAFFTSKRFVFHSDDWSAGVFFPEMLKFFGSRVVSGLLETGVLAIMVDYMGHRFLVWKLIVTVFVVTINYIFSILVTFRKD